MTITEILYNEELTSSEKLVQLKDLVASIRDSYGNSDVELEESELNTTYGFVNFSALAPDSKVEILRNEALRIKHTALECVKHNTAVVLSKKVEELIATNEFFTNISNKLDLGPL